ncbi:hypothetical protein [Candidatus Rickettsia kedanie]|uniref:hypothetical protein n=1 Tax=Candidatus Rickettsia kedanie TaxID=3115352 RepID=UPI00399CA5A2
MNISHYPCDGNRAKLVASYCNTFNAYKLPEPHISRILYDNQSSSEFYHVKTITVLINFVKFSSYDDA